ncbi:MAG: hypothetical protein ACRCW0_05170 [Clostridium sp.]
MLRIADYEKILEKRNERYTEGVKEFMQYLLFKQKENNLQDSTVERYFLTYINNIFQLEEVLEKKLALWNEEDVKVCLQGFSTNSPSTYRLIFSIIDNFKAWTNDENNPCNSLKIEDLMIFNKAALNNKLIGIDELFNMWQIIKQEKNDTASIVNEQNFAMVLLMRSGLKGKAWNEVLALQPGDLDRENHKINVTNRVRYLEEGQEREPLRVIKVIEDVEDRVFDVLEKAYELKEGSQPGKGKGNNLVDFYYDDEGYIIKRNFLQSEITAPIIRRSVTNFFDAADKPYVNATDLFMNKMIDELTKIEETNKFLTTVDVQNVKNKYDLESKNYNSLRKYYEEIFDTEILDSRIDKDKNREDNRKQYYKDYYEKVLKEKRKKQKLQEE